MSSNALTSYQTSLPIINAKPNQTPTTINQFYVSGAAQTAEKTDATVQEKIHKLSIEPSHATLATTAFIFSLPYMKDIINGAKELTQNAYETASNVAAAAGPWLKDKAINTLNHAQEYGIYAKNSVVWFFSPVKTTEGLFGLPIFDHERLGPSPASQMLSDGLSYAKTGLEYAKYGKDVTLSYTKDVLIDAKDKVVYGYDIAADLASKATNATSSKISETYNAMYASAANNMNALYDGAASKVNTLYKGAADIASGIGDAVSSTASAAKDTVSSMAGSVKETVSATVNAPFKVKDAVVAFFSPVVEKTPGGLWGEYFVEKPSPASQMASSVGDSVHHNWVYLKDKVIAGYNGLEYGVYQGGLYVKDTTAYKGAASIASGIGDAVSSTASAVRNATSATLTYLGNVLATETGLSLFGYPITVGSALATVSVAAGTGLAAYVIRNRSQKAQ